ncbi:MAG: cytochrome-c peroxidase [Flavobacteriaceae bacterium]|nr:cytochrome-c peroxidase [Bacteroidia bacterium]NNK88487.1 cytochrome-c peroxidase [Flavobacteriaceae bacterium]
MKNLSKLKYLLVASFIGITSCASDDDNYQPRPIQSELESRIVELYGSKSELLLPLENDFSAIPSDPNNPITQSKVDLGRFLFHETGLAENPNMEEGRHMYSCASCHHADAGFQSGIRQGIGEGGLGFGISGEGRHKDPQYLEEDLDVQPIRTPAALNVAYQDVMLWNGQFGATGTNEGTESNWTVGTPKEANNFGFQGVETQVIAGIDVHRLVIDADNIVNSPYKILFDEAFPNDPPENRYSKMNAALAVAAYERTLLANQSPFQEWLTGDQDAMSDDETAGALVFFNEGRCYECHTGPGLNSMTFHALGMNDLAGENISAVVDMATKKGRGGFTGDPADDFKFKTPQLYNLKDVHFYGHGGSFQTLKEVVEYKNNAIGENTDVPTHKLSPLFTPLNLSEEQIDNLVLFLENALHDSNLIRYVPEELPTGNCFPNADYMSTEDLGCE